MITLYRCKNGNAHRHKMSQHVNKFALLRPLRQHLMKRAEIFGADFSIKNNNRQISPIDSWIPVIRLV